MELIITDPIYGVIQLDPSTKKLIRAPEISSERKRLERIKNLGLIHIAFPSATHSKWEHHLGMLHLAEQVQLKSELKSRLRVLCLLGGTGHLAYTYPSEEAVLIASQFSSRVRKDLEVLLSETWRMVSGRPGFESPESYREIMVRLQVEELHAWISAYKLKCLPTSIELGDRGGLIYDRLSAGSEINKLYRLLGRFDYVQRDLYYTGLARFSLSSESFFRRYQGSVVNLRGAPESRLIDQLRDYLMDTLYLEVRSGAVEALFKKRLAHLLMRGSVRLRDLLTWSDGQLESAIETHSGRKWWDELTHSDFTHVASKRFSWRQTRNMPLGLSGLESLLLGRKRPAGNFLNQYPQSHGFVLTLGKAPDQGGFLRLRGDAVVSLSVIRKPVKLRPIACALWEMQRQSESGDLRWRRLRSRGEVGHKLLGFIMDGVVTSNYRPLAEVLCVGFSSLPKRLRNSVYSEVRNALQMQWLSRGELRSPDFWETHIGGFSEEGSIQRSARILSELIRSAARSSKLDLAVITEAAIWAAEHGNLRSASIKWVIPNVSVDGRNGPNQIDAVSVFVRGHSVVVRLIECSKSDSEGKAMDDLQKLEKISSRCKSFGDLKIEKKIFGAAEVRGHFSPLEGLFQKFGIGSKRAGLLRQTVAPTTRTPVTRVAGISAPLPIKP